MIGVTSISILHVWRRKAVKFNNQPFSFRILTVNLYVADLAVQRLQAIFLTFMIRRMKDSMLDGKRLIELPEKNVELVRLEFTAEERDVYKMV